MRSPSSLTARRSNSGGEGTGWHSQPFKAGDAPVQVCIAKLQSLHRILPKANPVKDKVAIKVEDLLSQPVFAYWADGLFGIRYPNISI